MDSSVFILMIKQKCLLPVILKGIKFIYKKIFIYLKNIKWIDKLPLYSIKLSSKLRKKS